MFSIYFRYIDLRVINRLKDYGLTTRNYKIQLYK
jgi:hypothetical protein